jgi:mono/diheme cytochrome c family protein
MKPRILAVLLLGLALAGCKGTTFDEPPVHVNPNMDFQQRFDPQEENPFFADHRAMRPVVAGTVARGFLNADTRFFLGREADGTLVSALPVPVTRALLTRGQERYNIYCAPCHGEAGDGRGIIMTGNYGYVPAPTYHNADLIAQPDGHYYDVILNGVRSMPSYAQQVPVADRWAIVAYIRALQRSQNAALTDIPEAERSTLQGAASNSN